MSTRTALRRLVSSEGSRLANRFMADVEPLIAVTEGSRVAGARRPTGARCAAAVAKAIRLSGVTTYTHPIAGDPELALDPRGIGRRLVKIHWEQRRPDALARFGQHAMTDLQDVLWPVIGERLTRAVSESCAVVLNEFSNAVAMDVIYGPIVTLSYAFLYACHGDSANYAELRPLLRLLPVALPVAESKDDPATWLVLTA